MPSLLGPGEKTSALPVCAPPVHKFSQEYRIVILLIVSMSSMATQRRREWIDLALYKISMIRGKKGIYFFSVFK